jgi:hypothetical protein
VGWALDRSTFPLGHEFRDSLSKVLSSVDTPLEVPPDAYMAMDYHFAWLHAAILWSARLIEPGKPHPLDPWFPDHKGTSPFEFNNEDLDLLIAFASGRVHHVVLIEAKGYTEV